MDALMALILVVASLIAFGALALRIRRRFTRLGR